MEDLNLKGTDYVDDLGKVEDFASLASPMEQFPQPLDSFKAEKTKKVGKCNLRKSLAWDAAFFTSAGVLDPDELSCMIDGVSSSKCHVLPGIEEDIYRSTDSLSTLGSENLTLESFEVDLFEDIRASIQKSSKASNRANSIKATSGDSGNEDIFSLKEDLASKSVAKSSAGPKKQTSRMQTPGKLNAVSSNSPKGTYSVAGIGDLTPSLKKATKANGRPILGPFAAAGRSSLRANQVQLENDKAKGTSSIAKVAPVPKTPGLTGSKRTVQKPVLSSKSSSSSSSTASKKKPPKFSSSSDSSTSTAPANSNPKRIAARSVNPTSANSILKPPSKVVMKKKVENGLSSSRSSKLSSSISPASSISEWSVASSSSTSSVNQLSNMTRAIIGAGCPRKSQDNAAPLNNIRSSTDRGLDRHDHNKMPRPNSEKPNAASAQRGQPLKPATTKPSGLRIPLPNSEKSNAASAQRGQPPKPEIAKPSGLRMPSPKIGFFDGVKPVVNTPNGSSLSRSGVPFSQKVGTTISIPTGVTSKAKSLKLQPTRLAKPVGNIKLDTHKSTSPLTSKKVSNASTKVHSSPKHVESPLTLSPLTQNEIDKEKLSKTEETGVKELSDANVEETEKISLVDVDNEISANLVNLKIVPMDGDIYDCKGKIASEENNTDVYIPEKNNTADLKSDGDLDEQMSASNLVNSKIVPADGDTYACEGRMAFKQESKDVTISENFSPNDLQSEMTLEQKPSANLMSVKIDPVDEETYDCEGEMASVEKNNDAISITEKISSVDVKNDLNLDVKMSANSGDVEIVAAYGEIYDYERKLSSEEKDNDVTSITKKITPAVMKNDMNLDVTMNANSGDKEVFLADKEVYYCEGEMTSKEKKNDVTSITEKTSPADVNKHMNLDVKMSAKSGNVKIGQVDGEIYDRGGNMASDENSNDVKSSIEKIVLVDLKSNMNMEVNMNASSIPMEIVPVEGDIYDCEKKIVSKKKSIDAVSIDDKISQDLENEMNLEVKLAQYLHNQYLHIHRAEFNLEEKIGDNSVNVKVASMDEDINEKEIGCQEKRGDAKSERHCLINNWNSLHKSDEKENQVKSLNFDVGHVCSEHDLQKENASNFISSPKNFGQTEELLSNLSKISQISETIVSSRTPFTDKNSSSNDERYDLLTEFGAEGMEKVTQLPSLECPPAEN